MQEESCRRQTRPKPACCKLWKLCSSAVQAAFSTTATNKTTSARSKLEPPDKKSIPVTAWWAPLAFKLQEKLPETQGARRGDAVAHSRRKLSDMASNDRRIKRNPEDEVRHEKAAQTARPCILLQSTLQPHHAVAAAAHLQQTSDVGTQEHEEGHASSFLTGLRVPILSISFRKRMFARLLERCSRIGLRVGLCLRIHKVSPSLPTQHAVERAQPRSALPCTCLYGSNAVKP